MVTLLGWKNPFKTTDTSYIYYTKNTLKPKPEIFCFTKEFV
jgi:hypothetical protein